MKRVPKIMKVVVLVGMLLIAMPVVLYGLTWSGLILYGYEAARIDAIAKFEEAKIKGRLKKGFVYAGPDESGNARDDASLHFIWRPKPLPQPWFYYVVSVDRHTLEVKLLVQNEGVPGFEFVPTF